MKITGSCHCQAIRYEAEVDPAMVTVCHCTDCQRLTGSAYRVTVRSLPGTFKLLAGTPRAYLKTTADSGRVREHAFCETCGSPIYATTPGPDPKVYGLRTGTIDQRAQLVPMVQIWARSALSWLDALPAVRKVDKEL